MDLHDDDCAFGFAECLMLALSEALNGRDLRVAQLRYGLAGGEPSTLQAIGSELGVSRERVRQLLVSMMHQVNRTGRRQMKAGANDGFCAALLIHLNQVIRPQEEGHLQRLLAFCEHSLSHLPPITHSIPLVAALTYSPTEARTIIPRARARAAQEHRRMRLQLKSERLSERRRERFAHLLKFVIWPQGGILFQRVDRHNFTHARHVSQSEAGQTGTFLSAKLNRPVEYEAKLELEFLTRLEDIEDVAWYQEQPLKVPYEVDGQQHIYYPDLLIALQDERVIVVEIKPAFKMALRKNLVQWTALRKYCAERGWGILITDGRRAIQEILRRSLNPQYVEEVLNQLQCGSLTWVRYRAISSKYSATTGDFLALVLKEKLDWSLGPFSLSLPGPGQQG